VLDFRYVVLVDSFLFSENMAREIVPRNYFYKEASKLQLNDGHEEIEQFKVYYDFKSSVRKHASVLPDHESFLATEYANWYTRNVIYGNQWQAMFRIDKTTGKKIWTTFSAASVSTAVQDFRPYLRKNPLPIVFLSGGLEEINKGGHCYTVVIESQPTRKMWIKDPKADEWARVREKPRQIAEKLGIKEIGIIHGLPTESSSQCILEAYRFLGQMLDGKYRNGFLNLRART